MLELGFSLLDYLIKLLEKKEGNVDEYFDIYIKPAYEISEKVFSDYLNLLYTVKKKIKEGASKREVIEILENGRLKYLPLRRQLLAEVNNRWPHGIESNELPKFEKGILGILIGGLASFEPVRTYYSPYGGSRGHTLLDVIMRLRTVPVRTEEEYELQKNQTSYTGFNNRDWAKSLMIVDRQIEALERAWQDVVEGYSEYKAVVAIKPARIKKLQTDEDKKKLHKYKRQGD